MKLRIPIILTFLQFVIIVFVLKHNLLLRWTITVDISERTFCYLGLECLANNTASILSSWSFNQKMSDSLIFCSQFHLKNESSLLRQFDLILSSNTNKFRGISKPSNGVLWNHRHGLYQILSFVIIQTFIRSLFMSKSRDSKVFTFHPY